MEENIKAKTGKSVAEWVKIVKKENFSKHNEMVKFLKSNHSFTHGYANFVAHKTRESDAASFDEEDLIQMQYKGKEPLQPIMEKILAEIKTFGDDIDIVPKKANVSLRRKKQFALIQPSTKTRIDLGLKLRHLTPEGRLESSGPFGTMCTHRVKLTEVSDVDSDVILWLRMAYDEAL